ncbi:MAG: hypothetical protein NWR50_06250, partial [Crocinitomicaceae bacterium]|nr:hypothetical protein [Crocinitomicaceae bacterium]
MKEQNELEQMFSSAFDGFEVTPPIHLKTAIDERLFSGKIEDRKNRRFIWLFPLIGIFFIGRFITLSFDSSNHSNRTIQKTSSRIANQPLHPSMQQNSTNNLAVIQMIEKKKQSSNSTKNHDELVEKAHLLRELNKSKRRGNNNGTNTATLPSKPFPFAKKSGVKNASNRSIDYSKVKKDKRTPQKIVESKIVIVDVTKDKLNENINLVGPTIDKFATDERKSIDQLVEVISENELINQSLVSEATNEKQKPSAVSKDSLKSIIQQTQIAPLAAPSKWSVGLYAGTLLGVNSLNTNSNNYYEINSPAGFSSSIEVNYGLNSKWSIATGLGYSTFIERISAVIYDTTLIPNGMTVEYIYLNPNLQDSIIDSIVTVNYITEISASDAAQKINYSVFSMPIYSSFSL